MPTTTPRLTAQEVRADVRRRLTSKNNLDWLLTYVCMDIRDHLLKAFPPPDPPDVTKALIEHLGHVLSQAVLEKLARSYPNDVRYGLQKVLAYHPDRAAALINQALCVLRDVWINDLITHPSDTFGARAQRLAPRLSALPNLRGRSAIGNSYLLWCFVIYELTYERVKQALGVKAWKGDAGPDVRAYNLCRRVKALRRAFRVKAVQRMFPDVDLKDLTEWAPLSPSQIALRLTLKAMKAYPGLKSTYLKHTILPRMRRLAQALEQALSH